MDLNIPNELEKSAVFEEISAALKKEKFTIVNHDETRPWGGFFVIDEGQAAAFAAKFFPHLDMDTIRITEKLSPKILVVAPQKRLSWQFHYRRAEIWKILSGVVGIKTSLTDEEGDIQEFKPGTFVQMNKGERHRLIGLNSWGIVAEIWQHTEPGNPSDEEDIVRLQDDFGR
ncbi:phosphoheptose isomerase [Flavobacterium sp. XN-5]|uniref:phosphoheptose isomerase n=1 Tax=Flavobacterium sp. XN-5 TaxID=2599390 RepID=UPI0011CAE69A|nr:phosphoheptose isomerase [Flavobacterium sp. XN-5]NGY36854.1 phosphoheptose isomerase [Flavobacterium sp. XN-5]